MRSWLWTRDFSIHKCSFRRYLDVNPSSQVANSPHINSTTHTAEVSGGIWRHLRILHKSLSAYPIPGRFLNRFPKELSTFMGKWCEVFLSKSAGSSLVGGIPTPLKNMSSSIGMMTFQIYGKIKVMFQTTNQINYHPVIWSSDAAISAAHLKTRVILL